FKKGKKRPFEILKKNVECQEALKNFRNAYVMRRSTEIFEMLEKFICEIYDCKAVKINEVRYDKFIVTYKSKKINELFHKKYLSYDSSNLPPCKSELHQHFLRTQYIVSILINAHLTQP